MRYWRIINPEAKNWVGRLAGFKLEATSPVQPFVHPNSPSGAEAPLVLQRRRVSSLIQEALLT
jgi:primary-amine oxidase